MNIFYTNIKTGTDNEQVHLSGHKPTPLGLEYLALCVLSQEIMFSVLKQVSRDLQMFLSMLPMIEENADTFPGKQFTVFIFNNVQPEPKMGKYKIIYLLVPSYITMTLCGNIAHK